MANAASEPVRPLVFFDVMKCGGTSVRRALTDAAPRGRDDVFALDGRAAMSAVGGIVNQVENWRFRSELLAYLLHGSPPPVILGHFRYSGLLADLEEGADFITLLRPPIGRLVSLYRCRRFSGRGKGVKAPPSLSEAMADPFWVPAGHHYVETFCGDPALDPRSDNAIEAAITNLSRFKVVGDTADMADFVSQVSSVWGRPVAANRNNPSPAPESHEDDAERLEFELASFCTPDQHVYDAVLGS